METNKRRYLKTFEILKFISKKKLIVIFLMMLFHTLLETFSLGLILPIISSFFQDDFFKLFVDTPINNYLKISNQKDFISLLLITLFLAYIFKFLFSILVLFIQNKFILSTYFKISKKLISKYIYNDYLFHVQNNLSTLIRNLRDETKGFIFNVVMRIFNLTLDILILIFFSIFLFFYNFEVTLIIFLFILVLSFLYLFIVRKKLIFIGKKRALLEKINIQNIVESLSGIKEIKILSLERFFIERFSINLKDYTEIQRKFAILHGLPKQIIDVIAVTIFIFFIFISSKFLYEMSEILILFGIYSAAALKLIPIFSRIIISLQQYSFNSPSVDIIYEELFLKNKNSNFNELKLENNLNELKEIKDFKEIKFKNVSFKYENNKQTIFENANLSIKRNSHIGIFGPSGSGKSTLADLLVGLLKPFSGEILIDDVPLSKISLKSFRSIMSYCQQTPYLLDGTVKQNIILDKDFNENSFIESLKLSSVDKFLKTKIDNVDTFVGERGVMLSGGQKQRVSIARAAYNQPKIIILDEATNALDKKTQNSILEEIKIKVEACVIISHDQDALNHCDEVYELKEKKLILIKK